MVSARLCFIEDKRKSPLNYMQARHTDLPKQKILHNLQQLTTDHTVRRCTCISEADLDISIKGKGGGGGAFYFQKPFFF